MTETTLETPTIFNFHNHDIRVAEIKGQPWFVAKDALTALSYSLSSHGMILTKLDEGESILRRIEKGRRSMRLVSEAGLYKLVMRSDKPEAKDFQGWVTRAVLPAIRKDGGYILDEEKVATGEMSEDELILRAMEVQQRKVERLITERDEALAIVAEQAPKVADYDARWSRKDTIGLTEFASQVGLRKNKFTEALREMGYLFNRGSRRNVPYAHCDNIYFICRETSAGFSQTFLTQAGSDHFLEKVQSGVFDSIKVAA